MEEKKALCPHCGAKMKMWKHSITSGLVQSLMVFAKALKEKGVNEVHLQRDAQLNKNQYNNFQKLKYFGLVAKVKDGDGKFKAGYWLLTRNGLGFLKGQIAISRFVKTFRNIIQERSEETVVISDVYNERMELVFFQDEFNYEIYQSKLL